MGMATLDLIETIQAEEISMERVYGREGISTRMLRERYKQSPKYLARLATAQTFMKQVLNGERPMYHLREVMDGRRGLNCHYYGLQETMTTSDFSNLFGDVLDRLLLGQYDGIQKTWPLYLQRGTVNDFRTVRRLAIDGLRTPLATVPEQTSYPQHKLADTKYSYAVTKRGDTTSMSWEVIVNDDLGAFQRIPQLWADAAVNTEEKEAASLFFNSSGFLTSIFTAGNKNIINTTNGASATNPALAGLSALKDAYIVLSKQVDADGNPINAIAATLVVPPDLALMAQQLVRDVSMVRLGAGGSTSSVDVTYSAPGSWQTNISIAVNKYLPLVNTTSGKTSWLMFANPATSRPAGEIGFLRGRESPEIFLKSANAIRLGGGSVGPLEGSFESDTVDYKIRHTLGSVALEPRAVVVSNGTGS